MTDSKIDQLLPRLARGDEHAFAELFDLVSPRLLSTALKMLRRREDAEDAVQEVFVSLARYRTGLYRVHNLHAYLFTVLRRVAGRRAKSRKLTPTINEFPFEHIAEVNTPPESLSECDDKLDSALNELPTAQREVLALKFEAGLTFAEIGEVLEISINTASSRYRYALEKLQAQLEELPC